MGDDGLPHGCRCVVEALPVVYVCSHKLQFISFHACNATAAHRVDLDASDKREVVKLV